MINVKHPNEALNASQNKFLESLSKEEKVKHALLFSYGNAAFKYHSLKIEPNMVDYNEWIEGLKEPIKSGMSEMGFEKCKGVFSFTRYVREKNDIGMVEFLKKEMGTDFDKYQQLFIPE